MMFIFSFYSLKLLNLCSIGQDVTVQFWNDIIEICDLFLELRNFRTIFICLLGSFLPGFSNFSLLRFKFLHFFFSLFFSLIEIFLEFLKFLFINILIMIDDLKILMIDSFKWDAFCQWLKTNRYHFFFGKVVCLLFLIVGHNVYRHANIPCSLFKTRYCIYGVNWSF